MSSLACKLIINLLANELAVLLSVRSQALWVITEFIPKPYSLLYEWLLLTACRSWLSLQCFCTGRAGMYKMTWCSAVISGSVSLLWHAGKAHQFSSRCINLQSGQPIIFHLLIASAINGQYLHQRQFLKPPIWSKPRSLSDVAQN